MNSMTDEPQARPGSIIRTPKQYELRGDIALSLAICHADVKGAQALLDEIVLLEPLNHIDLVISLAGGTDIFSPEDWMAFHKKATGFFRTVYINKVRDMRPQFAQEIGKVSRDWRPNNNMFRAVCDFFMHFMKSGAFYYLEPDCAILKRDWFSQLSAEYRLARKPFMGVIRQAQALDGSALPQHMNGSGFYPNPVSNYSAALYAASLNKDPQAAPFDVAGGGSVTPQCKPTKLICVDFTPMPQISPEAVVWHGDKGNNRKYSMIDELTGKSAERPHFQETLTTDIAELPDRVLGKLQFLSEGTPTTAQEAIAILDQYAPKNAYEAYLQALNAHGHCKASWMRAVKTFKAQK